MPRVVPPNVNKDDEFFWAGVQDDRLLIRKCAGCSRLQHPPTPMCPQCSSVEWQTEEMSGRGSVYSWIVSRHPNRPEDEPRIVAVVSLEEGVRLVSNVAGIDPSDVWPGLPVVVGFEDFDGTRLPQFRPAGVEG